MTEPTLIDVAHALWAAKLRLLAGAAAGVCAAGTLLVLSVPHYRVTMIVGPATPLAAPSVETQAGGQAYLSPAAGGMTLFENILRGPSVAGELMRDPQWRDGLAHNGRFIFSPVIALDNPQQMAERLQKEITIEPVGSSDLRRISVDTPSPAFGAGLLKALYADANDVLRGQAGTLAQKRVSSLKAMLDKTASPDERRTLATLLERQQQTSAILGANEPFAAEMIEPPASSSRPWWPRRALIFCGFAFAGALLAYATQGQPERK